MFDADISFSQSLGLLENEQRYSPLSLFGFEMPFGITTCELEEYKFSQDTMTEPIGMTPFMKRVYVMREIFSDYEIKDRHIEDNVTENGVTATVTYTLYGELCREVEFLLRNDQKV